MSALFRMHNRGQHPAGRRHIFTQGVCRRGHCAGAGTNSAHQEIAELPVGVLRTDAPVSEWRMRHTLETCPLYPKNRSSCRDFLARRESRSVALRYTVHIEIAEKSPINMFA